MSSNAATIICISLTPLSLHKSIYVVGWKCVLNNHLCTRWVHVRNNVGGREGENTNIGSSSGRLLLVRSKWYEMIINFRTVWNWEFILGKTVMIQHLCGKHLIIHKRTNSATWYRVNRPSYCVEGFNARNWGVNEREGTRCWTKTEILVISRLVLKAIVFF